VFQGALVPASEVLQNQAFSGELDFDPHKGFPHWKRLLAPYQAANAYGERHEDAFVRLIAAKYGCTDSG
jgi:hypothetical protein